jgi:hypothetical protein
VRTQAPATFAPMERLQNRRSLDGMSSVSDARERPLSQLPSGPSRAASPRASCRHHSSRLTPSLSVRAPSAGRLVRDMSSSTHNVVSSHGNSRHSVAASVSGHGSLHGRCASASFARETYRPLTSADY